MNLAGPLISSLRKSDMSVVKGESGEDDGKRDEEKGYEVESTLTDTAIFTAYKPPRNTTTLEFVAFVQRRIGIVSMLNP